MTKIYLFIIFISIFLSIASYQNNPNDSQFFSSQKKLMSYKAKIEKRKNFDIKGRKLPTEKGIYIVDNYQKIKIISDFIRYEVTQKLYVVSTMGIAFNSVSIEAEVNGDFIKMETIRAFLENEGKEEQINYQENSPKFTINGILFDGDIISLRYTYICYSKDLFTKFIPLAISKKEPKYGICKLSFEAEGNIVILGTMNNNLPFDGEKIYYEHECPEGEFIDYVVLTRYAVQLSTNYTFKEINKDNNREILIPKVGFGGNNYILDTKISPLNIDNINFKIEKQNESHYIVKYDKFKKEKPNLNLNVNFINSIDIDFKFPFNESLIIDTSTEKTKRKAKEILVNDHTKNPDYIKLGKWVKNNMKYDSNLNGANVRIDDILLNLTGDYSSYTRLYNSLLFSIGIKAVYVNGYVIQGETRAPDKINFVYHAWTMAKIDGKWKALDATWGLFFDIFPISHVFLNFNDFPKQSGKIIEPQINKINFIESFDRNKLFKLIEKKENEKITQKKIEKENENKRLIIGLVIVCILFIISMAINVLNCIKNKKLKEKIKNMEDEDNNNNLI